MVPSSKLQPRNKIHESILHFRRAVPIFRILHPALQLTCLRGRLLCLGKQLVERIQINLIQCTH